MNFRHLFQYRLRTLLLVMLVVACSLAFHTHRVRQEHYKELVRQIVASELTVRHWDGLEPTNSKPMMTQLAEDFGGVPGWQFEILNVPGNVAWLKGSPTTPSDDFTRKAVARIQGGEDEVWRFGLDGSVRYVSAVGITRNCLKCHVFTGRAVPRNFGIVSLQLKK